MLWLLVTMSAWGKCVESRSHELVSTVPPDTQQICLFLEDQALGICAEVEATDAPVAISLTLEVPILTRGGLLGDRCTEMKGDIAVVRVAGARSERIALTRKRFVDVDGGRQLHLPATAWAQPGAD